MTNDRPVFGIATAPTEHTIAPDQLGRWLEAHGLCQSQLETAKDGLTVADYSQACSVLG